MIAVATSWAEERVSDDISTVPPHDLEAEASVLGSMLLCNGSALRSVTAILTKDMFWSHAHRVCFEAMVALAAEGSAIDLVTLSNRLRSEAALELAGGAVRLRQLLEVVPSAENAAHYARIVHALWVRREAMFAGRKVATRAASEPTADVARSALEALARTAGDGAWDPPTPLGHVDLPPWPVHVLPDWIADWVACVAEELQVPVELPGMLVLAALSTAVSGRWRLAVRGTWKEPLNLFVVVSLPPGCRKSAAFSLAIAPIEEHERALLEETKSAIAEAASKHKAIEARVRRAERRLAEGSSPEAEEELLQATEALAHSEVPQRPQLLTADVTSEQLATLLQEQGGRMALLSPEGGIFDVMAGLYAKGAPNIEVYLKGHAGETLRVDRRGRSERVDAPALTVGLCVQPEVLRALEARPGFRGRGLLDRFLYAVPPSPLGSRKVAPVLTGGSTLSEYRTRMLGLLRRRPATPEALLRLGLEGDYLLREFETAMEARLGPEGDLADFSGWGSKLPGAACRIAGLLHLAGGRDDGSEVEADTLQRAIEIAEVLIDHAHAAFRGMGEAAAAVLDAERFLRWIRRHDRIQFRRRDLWQAMKGGRFRQVADLDQGLRALEESGYLRPLDPENMRSQGRSPSTAYLVNPFVVGGITHVNRPVPSGSLQRRGGAGGGCGWVSTPTLLSPVTGFAASGGGGGAFLVNGSNGERD